MTKFRTSISIVLTLFVLFVIFWLAQFNRDHILYYQEQMQLFRFSWFYFHTYWIKPGGMAEYLGAFLTQFYFYPWFGAMIVSSLLAGVYLLVDSICRRNGKIEFLFAMLFIPPLLWMMALTTQLFVLSYLLGMMIGLIGFCVYITFKKPVRYLSGFIIFLIVYVLAAGNALLFILLALIFELFSEKRLNHYLYIAALIAWAALIPFLAFRFVYTVTLHEAFWALTPFSFLFSDFVNISAWLSIPVLYVCWRGLANRVHSWKPSVWKIGLSCILVTGMCIGSMTLTNNQRSEVLTGMAFGVQNNNWGKVIKLGTSYPYKNNLVSYLTNISLAELGQLPYRMFHYEQIGPSGLFLEWQTSNFTLFYIGEVYYRLGLIQEAEHSAYEAMVSNAREHPSLTLRRLVTTSIIMRDTALFTKYIRLFDQTLFYRSWANEQRRHMAAALADSTYTLPGAPQVALHDDFFLRYARPDLILDKLLERDPNHRLAFEYLMAWYMLDKDIESMKKCMDTYFHQFSYPNIPVHYEEALMVYQNVNPTVDIFAQYPISETTRERFNNYMQAHKLASTNRQMMTQLYQHYGNSYWFYLHFMQPELLQRMEDETNRY